MHRIGLTVRPILMPGRTVLLAIVVGLVLIVANPTATSARGDRTKHETTATFRLKLLDASGPHVTYTGVVGWVIDGGKERLGVVESRGSVTGQPDPSNPSSFEIAGDIFYFPEGSIKDTRTGTTTLHPDGSRATTHQGRFVDGTRKFRGAAGTYTATCSNPDAGDPTSITTCELHGQLSY